MFGQFGTTTKYEIAKKLVAGFPELKPRMPKPRKLWESEDYSMGLFDALSLAMTHYYLTE